MPRDIYRWSECEAERDNVIDQSVSPKVWARAYKCCSIPGSRSQLCQDVGHRRLMGNQIWAAQRSGPRRQMCSCCKFEFPSPCSLTFCSMKRLFLKSFSENTPFVVSPGDYLFSLKSSCDCWRWTFMDRTVWIYCYNPLYHRGELKGKVLHAGPWRDQLTRKHGIPSLLHQPSEGIHLCCWGLTLTRRLILFSSKGPFLGRNTGWGL